MEQTEFTRMIQIGMVVRNLDETIANFERLLGLGPFRVVEYPPTELPECMREYHGMPGNFTARFGFFHFGNVELEIIQPVSGESVWTDFLNEKGPGLHHLKFSVDRHEPVRAELEAQGYTTAQQGAAVGPNRGKVWSYYDMSDSLSLWLEVMNEVIVP